MRAIVFEGTSFNDFVEWGSVDKKMYQRTVTLILDMLRSPFTGLGKPEPLKHELQGCWSRRINDEHRLVYRVTADSLIASPKETFS